MGAIRDEHFQVQLLSLQKAMHSAADEGDLESIHKAFQQCKALASAQNKRLSKITQIVVSKVEFDKRVGTPRPKRTTDGTRTGVRTNI